MPFIKFTQTRQTVEERPQVFEAGRVYELSEESCERWKRRGVAVDASAPEPTPEPENKPAPVKTAKGKKAEA